MHGQTLFLAIQTKICTYVHFREHHCDIFQELNTSLATRDIKQHSAIFRTVEQMALVHSVYIHTSPERCEMLCEA